MNQLNFLKLSDKYCDLCIDIKSTNVDVQSIFCRKSPFFDICIQREQEHMGKWPPVSNIQITLPDNLDQNCFIIAIKFLYNEHIEEYEEQIINIIESLKYMLVDLKPLYTSLIELLSMNIF